MIPPERWQVSRAPLKFYKGGHLVCIADPSRRGASEQFVLDVPGEELILLDWTNEPILNLNERHPPYFDDESVIEYCRFFFHFVRGQLGRFLFVPGDPIQ